MADDRSTLDFTQNDQSQLFGQVKESDIQDFQQFEQAISIFAQALAAYCARLAEVLSA